MLNAREMWRNFKLSGGERSFAELGAYWENQGYLTFYNVKAIFTNNSSNDINNYLADTGVGRGGILGSALAITGLNVLSEVFADKIEGVFGGKIVAPRFEEYLTSSGEPLLGIQTIVRPGGSWPALEVNLDATPTFSDFTLGVKAHEIPVPYVEGFSFSPFISVSDWGISGGTDLTYDFNSRLGIKLTGGYRDSTDPLNAIEGKAPGWYGKLNATIKFGGR
jgi:hypothetical protein